MPKGLCKYCKNWAPQCGLFPAHCSERERESFTACNLTSDYLPFEPVDGLPYSREYIIEKWTIYVKKELGIA